MFEVYRKKRSQNKFFKYFGIYLVNLSQVVFITSAITYIVYLLLEKFKTGLISNYFDLNLLLAVCLVSGLFTVLFYENKAKHHKVKKNYQIAAVFAIISGLFSWQYFEPFGRISVILGLVVGLAVYVIIIKFNQLYD